MNRASRTRPLYWRRVQGSQRSLLGLALVLGASALAYRGVLGLELLGWDSYPTLAASRIRSPGDLAGTFREELMDGRYPGGRFHRPFTNLLFALDFAAWGLDPFGYHSRTSSCWHRKPPCSPLLRLLGAGASLGRTAAFALHPLQLGSRLGARCARCWRRSSRWLLSPASAGRRAGRPLTAPAWSATAS
jgi:hypothetical protein